MLSGNKIYYTLLYFLLKVFFRSEVISSYAQDEIDPRKPVIYVLHYQSIIDLLAIRISCLEQGLPDPIEPLNINGITLPRYFLIDDSPASSSSDNAMSLFHEYLKIHRSYPELDVKIVPIYIMFDRDPLKGKKCNLQIRIFNDIAKFIKILFLGRDSFIYFSKPLSMRSMVRTYAKANDKDIVQKFYRMARIHFARRRFIATGPYPPIRKVLFQKILTSQSINQFEEERRKKFLIKNIQKEAITIMKEIASNVSYRVIRISDWILGCILHYLYKELHIRNAERLRHMAENGYEMVYLPCHRSHMDYLLLSYVLYHQGMTPPHIAAGLNLNFWPAGPIFRRLGAFFIRRKFKGNKLYSTIFREYLNTLFTYGYSVEYFIEGGRSRTGLLLEPKTGMISMTIQAILLRSGIRPIVLVPVYIGYEHLIDSYTEDKKGIIQLIRGLCRLRNFGNSYITFGEPLLLTTWLNKNITQWRDYPLSIKEDLRPSWLPSASEKIATTIMVRINNAAAVNSINLCSSILFSSPQRCLTKTSFLSQLSCHLAILRNVPYSSDVTVPKTEPEHLLEEALAMDKLTMEYKTCDTFIFLSSDQTKIMTYYRNNIKHLLILPSLIACIIRHHPTGIFREQLYYQIGLIYPMVRAELFMRYNTKELPLVLDRLIVEFQRQRLIHIQESLLFPIETTGSPILDLLSGGVHETLYRYAITFSLLLNTRQLVNRHILERNSKMIARWISLLHCNHSPAFFEQSVFSTLISTLFSEHYIGMNGLVMSEKVKEIDDILSKLILSDILNSIRRISLLVN